MHAQHTLDAPLMNKLPLAHVAYDCVDRFLAWLFGLDASKYQWAIAHYELQQQEVLLGLLVMGARQAAWH